jgi:RNA polymerase sigma factor (sigma-70 family)
MSGQKGLGDFEQDTLRHLKSAYHLARSLTRNEQDADDIVQEAYLRALRSYQSFQGGNARPWLLKIVRNVYYTSLRKARSGELIDFDEDLVSVHQRFANPEEALMQNSRGVLVRMRLEMLPACSREMLILRGLAGMSYKQISTVVGVPTGTVMSRLSRARALLRQSVSDLTNAGLT